jgi:hypothetical protein
VLSPHALLPCGLKALAAIASEGQMIRALPPKLAFLFLASCGSVSVNEYAAEKPPFDLREYFNGGSTAGAPSRTARQGHQAHVRRDDVHGCDTGTFDERFTSRTAPKGARDHQRPATIQRHGRGWTAPLAAKLGQRVSLAVRARGRRDGGGTIELDMDDWMWLLDGKTVMNRTSFSKLGIRFGEVSFFFRKRD